MIPLSLLPFLGHNHYFSSLLLVIHYSHSFFIFFIMVLLFFLALLLVTLPVQAAEHVHTDEECVQPTIFFPGPANISVTVTLPVFSGRRGCWLQFLQMTFVRAYKGAVLVAVLDLPLLKLVLALALALALALLLPTLVPVAWVTAMLDLVVHIRVVAV